MAAPNILRPTTMTFKNDVVALTTSLASLISNASSSGKVILVLSLYVTNIDGTDAADVTIQRCSAAAAGGTASSIAPTVAIAPDTAVVVIDKNSLFILEEDKSIGGLASANGDLLAHMNWVEIT